LQYSETVSTVSVSETTPVAIQQKLLFTGGPQDVIHMRRKKEQVYMS